MSNVRILKVTIDHFRGYRSKKNFELGRDNNITILSGPNGYGKTSFFDSIEWGLTGKLTRYEGPNEEKTNSCFINYQPFEKPAKVEIEFGDRTNKYTLTRISLYSEGHRTDYGKNKSVLIIKGKDIGEISNEQAEQFLNDYLIKDEWKDKVTLGDLFGPYHLLTQDKIKLFIQGIKGPDRYRQISNMVGTQRFFDFIKLLETKNKNVKSEKNILLEQKEKLLVLIDNLDKIIKEDLKLDLGKHENIQEWFEDMLSEYRKIVNRNNLEEKYINTDDKIIDKVSILKSNIFDLRKGLDKYKKSLLDLEPINLKLQLNYPHFVNDKEQLKLIKNKIPFIEKKKKLDKVNKKISLYKEFYDKTTKLDKEINKTKKKLSQVKLYLERLNIFYKDFDLLLDEIDRINNNDYKLERKLDNLIDLVLRRIPKFNCNTKKIYVNDNIILEQYKYELPKSHKRDMSDELNTLIEKECLLYINKFKEVAYKTSKLNEKLITIRKKVEDLKNDVANLSKVDRELKSILKESLNYIKNIQLKEELIKCPVCDSNFKSVQLTSKIESKLIQDNELISSKIIEQKNKESCLNELEKQLSDGSNNYRKIYENLILKIKETQKLVLFLGQQIRQEEKLCLSIIDNKNKEKDVLYEDQKTFINLIDSLGLNISDEELDKKITSLLRDTNDSLMNYPKVDSLNILELKDLEREVECRINIFEKDLRTVGITNYNVKEEIERKISDNHNKIERIEEDCSKIEFIDSELEKIHNRLTHTKRIEEHKQLIDQFNNIEPKLKNITDKTQVFEDLIDSSTKSIKKISEEILIEHEDFINTIFRRINPHPMFTKLKFDFNKNKSDNDILNIYCLNKDNNGKINPAFTFSSSQVNVVAVSIFLGMALRQQCTNLRTILLDDPIQNMDDINVLTFIDILRGAIFNIIGKDKKQFIISTHDQDVFRLMNKKFRFLNLKYFEFDDYDDQGPSFS